MNEEYSISCSLTSETKSKIFRTHRANSVNDAGSCVYSFSSEGMHNFGGACSNGVAVDVGTSDIVGQTLCKRKEENLTEEEKKRKNRKGIIRKESKNSVRCPKHHCL